MSFLSHMFYGSSPKTNVVTPGSSSTLDPTQQSIEGNQLGPVLASAGTTGSIFPSYTGPQTVDLSPLQSMSLSELEGALPGLSPGVASVASPLSTATSTLSGISENGIQNLQHSFLQGIVDPLGMNLIQNVLPQITSALGGSEGGPHSSAANNAIQQALTNFDTTATAAGANLTAAGQNNQISASGLLPSVASAPLNLVTQLLSSGSVPTTLAQSNLSNLFQIYNQGNQNTQQSIADLLGFLGTKTTALNDVVQSQGSPGLVQSILGNQGLGSSVGTALGSWLFS